MPKSKTHIEYPEKTRGSAMAAKLRKKANTLTEPEHDENFRSAMALIYAGGRRRKTAAIAR